jgi:hypothetical protein
MKTYHTGYACLEEYKLLHNRGIFYFNMLLQ